jgi:lysozyme
MSRAAWLLTLFAVFGALLSSAFAQSPSRWTYLKTEPSRAQLFQRYAKQEGFHIQALPSTFRFPADAIKQPDGTNRTDAIFGIDISHYEGVNFPFTSLARSNVKFVYIKATQGTKLADATFDHNWKTAGSLPEGQRIARGAYHFLSSNPKMSGKDQADSFVDFVNLHGGYQAGDLLPVVDLEWDVACQNCPDQWKTNKRTPTEIVQTTLDFLAEVKARWGRTPAIYTNKSFLADNKVTPALIASLTQGHKVWIFDLDSHDRAVELPNPASNLDHVLWQFTWTAKLTGPYAQSVDAEVFKGTPDEFNAALTGAD